MRSKKNIVLSKGTSSLRYSAFNTAAYYLGFKDRTRGELVYKLLDKGYSVEEIDEALYKLEQYGYVDDSRYARAYIKQNLYKKGCRRIVDELSRKGINRELSCKEAALLDIDEQNVIEDIFAKRFSDVDLSDDKQYRKVYSFFVRRGFKHEDIYKTVAKFRNIDEIF